MVYRPLPGTSATGTTVTDIGAGCVLGAQSVYVTGESTAPEVGSSGPHGAFFNVLMSSCRIIQHVVAMHTH
jgi:hypothetical protein